MARMQKTGFTLVEVSIAVCLVAASMLLLFGLFPIGLQESEYAVLDTQEAMFADSILSAMEANALGVTDWSTWSNLASLRSRLILNTYPRLNNGDWRDVAGASVMDKSGINAGIEFPVPSSGGGSSTVARYMRFRLRLSGSATSSMRKIELWTRSSQYGEFDKKCQIYVTQIFFSGM